MQKYEVEYACFRKVVFEANSQEQANDKAAIMEDEEIEGNSSSEGYVIWNEPSPINENLMLLIPMWWAIIAN